MYELFDRNTTLFTGRVLTNRFEYLKRRYSGELSKVKDYFRSRAFFVHNQHLLVRIIKHADIPLEYEVDQYARLAYTRGVYIAKHFRFTSELSYGEWGNGSFFGEDNDELYLYYESSFNPFTIDDGWRDLCPVTVLTHPFCETSMMPPVGINNSSKKGLVVICIDIPLLLMQYRSFMLSTEDSEVMYKNNDGLDARHFVRMYVLPNMLDNMFDITILNRLKSLYYNYEVVDKAVRDLPFPIVNYDSKMDEVLTDVLSHVENRQILYKDLLRHIPAVSHTDASELLMMPDIGKTRQVWWALMLTRWSDIMFLLNVGGSEARNNNKKLLRDLWINIKEFRSDKIFSKMLPERLYINIESDINKINEWL